jgi:fructose-bisphosphate aldolase class II
MKSLRQIIEEAEKKKVAIGHFNVSNLEQFKAVAETGIKLEVPVIIGLSEGEREYFGIHHFRDLVASYNSQYSRSRFNSGFWLYTNADHTHSFEKAIEAARFGFNAILFDGSRLPLEENIRLTKQAVAIVKRINPKILVEGELGYLGSSSEILKEVPQGAAIKPQDFTKPEEAERFVKETGVDLLAPAVGNIHGIISLKDQGQEFGNPRLDIKRIKEIRKAVNIPLVLHGGSGISDDDFLAAIDAGISIIHISTELRLVWRQTLEKALATHQDEVAPYKVLPEVLSAMEKLVERRLRLFNKLF